MPWVPFDQSPYANSWTFQNSESVFLDGSTIRKPSFSFEEFLFLTSTQEQVSLRLTFQSYEASEAWNSAPRIETDSSVYPSTSQNVSAWAPDPLVITVAAPADVFFHNAPRLDGSLIDTRYNILVEVLVGELPSDTSYNCDCDDDYPRTTLVELRKRLLRRLGFSAQVNRPPPGMPELLDDFIRQAQEMLFRRYAVFRTERFFTWDLVAGTRFYDLDANADECIKKLEPRMITWAGISQGDDSWRPLVCGIDPVMYTSQGPGIPSHYEVRQCIELWPAPVDTTWKLRVKGHFGLLPLEADDDETTIDPEAIFLLALANAKAHYGQPDAGNYASQLTTYVRDLIRGSHQTRRYFPGREDVRNAVQPIPVGGWK